MLSLCSALRRISLRQSIERSKWQKTIIIFRPTKKRKSTPFNGYRSSRLRQHRLGKMRRRRLKRHVNWKNAPLPRRLQRERQLMSQRLLILAPPMKGSTKCARTSEIRQRRRRSSMSMKSKHRSALSPPISLTSQQERTRPQLPKPLQKGSKGRCRSS